MHQPVRTPIGLHLTRVARVVSRAFDDALAQAGGSLPVWLILLNLKISPTANQRALAESVGVREATLTHHLNAMERNGLLTRRRDPHNRRIHIVELSDSGHALFLALRAAAVGFDAELRQGFSETETARLGRLLDRLAGNVGSESNGPTWAGPAETGTLSSRRHQPGPDAPPPEREGIDSGSALESGLLGDGGERRGAQRLTARGPAETDQGKGTARRVRPRPH